MDNSKLDIALVNNKKILETGTSNLFFVKKNTIYSSKKDFYEGITYKFFKKKINRIIKKDILLKDLKTFDEIILVGSGKGVASVKSINQISWKRKNFEKYKLFLRYYKKAIKNSKSYRF